MASQDTPQRYGTFTRLLHWTMAVLIGWQFLSAIAHFGFEDSAFEALFWPSHKPLGLILIVLVVIRLLWAAKNLANRPPAVNLLAKLGHLGLYALLFAVPALALLRQYGSGRAFEPFGITLMAGGGDKIEWMVDLGSLLHGELGWVLLAMIVGHIGMAFLHRKQAGQINVLPRMWGQ
ncbi:MAG: cytochrome b [Pseudomonadota bacterium]|nr:cytochrome b [Pseudomonadota bacterium]MEE3319818.1 cytochrome b [Pseudomonadota bacterium]